MDLDSAVEKFTGRPPVYKPAQEIVTTYGIDLNGCFYPWTKDPSEAKRALQPNQGIEFFGTPKLVLTNEYLMFKFAQPIMSDQWQWSQLALKYTGSANKRTGEIKIQNHVAGMIGTLDHLVQTLVNPEVDLRGLSGTIFAERGSGVALRNTETGKEEKHKGTFVLIFVHNERGELEQVPYTQVSRNPQEFEQSVNQLCIKLKQRPLFPQSLMSNQKDDIKLPEQDLNS